ncbi:hypothetical protein KIPB_008885, partial [Kipferlia bialata]|eukprot:g8885.t1
MEVDGVSSALSSPLYHNGPLPRAGAVKREGEREKAEPKEERVIIEDGREVALTERERVAYDEVLILFPEMVRGDLDKEAAREKERERERVTTGNVLVLSADPDSHASNALFDARQRESQAVTAMEAEIESTQAALSTVVSASVQRRRCIEAEAAAARHTVAREREREARRDAAGCQQDMKEIWGRRGRLLEEQTQTRNACCLATLRQGDAVESEAEKEGRIAMTQLSAELRTVTEELRERIRTTRQSRLSALAVEERSIALSALEYLSGSTKGGDAKAVPSDTKGDAKGERRGEGGVGVPVEREREADTASVPKWPWDSLDWNLGVHECEAECGMVCEAITECVRGKGKELRLVDADVCARGAVVLARTLYHLPRLTKITLHNCTIGDTGGVAIAQALTTVVELEE